MKPISLISILSFLLPLVCVSSCGPADPTPTDTSNVTLNKSDICDCEPDVDGPCGFVAWDNIINNQQDIDVRADLWSVRGDCFREELTHSWLLNSKYKQVFTGTLNNTKWNLGDDNDLNLYLNPIPAHESFLTPGSYERYYDYLKAEIDPDASLRSTPWFPVNGVSPLLNKRISVYGLWVTDTPHQGQKAISEIHPAEAIWWKESYPKTEKYMLMALYDVSGRFNGTANMDCGEDNTIGAEGLPHNPWIGTPSIITFKVYFEVDPNGPPVQFTIGEPGAYVKNVITKDDAMARKDCDEGYNHAIIYEGKTIVKVSEVQMYDDDLGIGYQSLCLLPNGKIRGFITITTKLTNNGYHIVTVLKSKD